MSEALCSVPGCGKPRGGKYLLCYMHRSRMATRGTLEIGTTRHWGEMCREPGCERHRRNSAGYCAKHEPPTYVSWRIMRERCNNPKCPAYPRYGGRGISIDPRWNDYAVFLEDMGERPPKCVIHRKDNDGNYTKANCKWLTRSEHQAIHNRMRARPRPCSMPGCDQMARALGLCAKHYQTDRWRAKRARSVAA